MITIMTFFKIALLAGAVNNSKCQKILKYLTFKYLYLKVVKLMFIRNNTICSNFENQYSQNNILKKLILTAILDFGLLPGIPFTKLCFPNDGVLVSEREFL